MIRTTCQECKNKAGHNGQVWTHDFSLLDLGHTPVPTTQAANKLARWPR